MDITVDSPNLEERDLYAYWHSPFSPYSVLTAIKDLYPTWTTGKVEDLNLFLILIFVPTGFDFTIYLDCFQQGARLLCQVRLLQRALPD